jgi:hypothetical protein
MAHRMKLRWLILLLILLIVFPGGILAEKVKPLNPDCDVCPVVISYEGEEARGILGKEGVALLLKLSTIKEKTSKIDLDGVKKTGSERDGNEGYELLVFSYKHMISINSIRDGAVVKIQTDFQNLNSGGGANSWAPEIYLTPPSFAAIQKDDDLKTAWDKVKNSTLYEYINTSNANGPVFKDNLRKMILYVLEAVTE